jgi:hypothetical protein
MTFVWFQWLLLKVCFAREKKNTPGEHFRSAGKKNAEGLVPFQATFQLFSMPASFMAF